MCGKERIFNNRDVVICTVFVWMWLTGYVLRKPCLSAKESPRFVKTVLVYEKYIHDCDTVLSAEFTTTPGVVFICEILFTARTTSVSCVSWCLRECRFLDVLCPSQRSVWTSNSSRFCVQERAMCLRVAGVRVSWWCIGLLPTVSCLILYFVQGRTSLKEGSV